MVRKMTGEEREGIGIVLQNLQKHQQPVFYLHLPISSFENLTSGLYHTSGLRVHPEKRQKLHSRRASGKMMRLRGNVNRSVGGKKNLIRLRR